MKTFLFIDGTNLYAAQYELFGPDRYLDFPFLPATDLKHPVKKKKLMSN